MGKLSKMQQWRSLFLIGTLTGNSRCPQPAGGKVSLKSALNFLWMENTHYNQSIGRNPSLFVNHFLKYIFLRRTHLSWVFIGLFTSSFNHNEYTTLEYNAAISIAGKMPALKSQRMLYAFESHWLDQCSIQKLASLSNRITMRRGRFMTTEKIHETGITI